MRVDLQEIPLREVLHFLGWRGTPLDEALIGQIREMTTLALAQAEPRMIMQRFGLEADGSLTGTAFLPRGRDMAAVLESCHEAILIAATMGAASERLLLRTQAQDAAKALLLDAVLSAGVEAVLDRQEEVLRRELAAQGLYLTDRFSPGYGDMPLAQTGEICEVLGTQKRIGLTVSQSGIMIPRKSVTAIMGVSRTPVKRRLRGCVVCRAREHCVLRRD